jgi:L-fuculose-phosphate aldolase
MSDQLDALIHHARLLVEDGLVIGTAGNVSLRVDDEIVVTPTSIPYDRIQREDLCVLDLAGDQTGGRRSASSEAPMHAQIYSATDATAIVHTHSPFATTIACVSDALPAIHYSIHRLGGDTVPVVEYELFGSDALADKVALVAKGRRGVLLRNHGAVTWGSSVAEAYDLSVLLEWLAQIYWQAKQLGEPRLLTAEEIHDVAEEARRRREAREAARVD